MSTDTSTTMVTSPDFELSKQMLLDTISNILKKKPTTKEEVLSLFHSIEVAIGPWLVSGLDPLEQKAVLLSLWVADQIQSVTSTKCLPFLK
jgi:hypothetical protein